jgi:VWFA-related protein
MDFGFEWHYRESRPTALSLASSPTRQPTLPGRAGPAALLLFVGLLPATIFISVMATAGQTSSGQEIATQDVQSTFQIKVQRNMVLVRVIVRDRNGRSVPRLRKEDFRLWDNGKPQEIDQFGVESSSHASTVAPPAPSKEPEGEAASEAGAANVTPRNYQALYFDDTQMTFEDVGRSRDAADRYLASKLTPADRAGIFTSSGQGNLDFTDDRSKLHEALFKLQPRGRISTGLTTCPDIGEYQAYLIVQQRDPDATGLAIGEYTSCICGDPSDKAAQATCAGQATAYVESYATQLWNQWRTQADAVLRGLEEVVRRTAVLPGQRSVIFLSPGFLPYSMESQIAQVAERALRSNVIVSALDPRGLYVITPGGDASQQDIVLSRRPDLNALKARIIRDGLSLDEQVLYGFAEDTGGQFFHNSNDLDMGFRQVGTLADVYYVLAFSPRNLKFDGRFHKLKVSLANPASFTLQARRGYFAPKASEDAAARAKEEIEQAIYSQDELRELPVDVHTRFFKLNESDARLSVLTHLDVSAVRFRKEQDRNLDNLTFITVLFDRDGKYVMGKEKRVEFHLRDSTLARLTQTGITLKTEFDVKAGTYLVRQIVRDSEAGQLSGLNRTVEIPY